MRMASGQPGAELRTNGRRIPREQRRRDEQHERECRERDPAEEQQRREQAGTSPRSNRG